MAEDRLLGPSWHQEQRPTRYPFQDSSSLRSSSGERSPGGLLLPMDLFLDARLYPAGARGPLWLESLEVGPGEATALQVTLRMGGPGQPGLCQGVLDPRAAPAQVRLEDPAGRTAGVLVLDPEVATQLVTWPTGVHAYGAGPASWALSCVACCPEPGLQEVVVPARGGQPEQVLSGDLWLVGGPGIVLRLLEAGEETGDVRIRVEAVGDPLFRRAACQDLLGASGELFVTPRFVQTLNGIGPDSRGEFHLRALGLGTEEDILRVRSEAGELILEVVGTLLTS